MFKKFTREDNIGGYSKVKSSEQRRIRKSIGETFPTIEKELDIIFPKKQPLMLAKGANQLHIIASTDNTVWFFSHHKGEWIPTLRTLHRFPDILPKLQVDKGAIKFVLSGANIMCPGLTSPGGKMDDVEEGTVCVIMAEGKEHALAVGVTKMSTDVIRSENQGIAVEVLHYLNDGLWRMPTL